MKLEKMRKNLVLGGPLGPNSGHQFFFEKNLAPSVTIYYGQLSSCTISEKTNDPILRNLSDRQTNRRQINSWTDERE